MATNPFPSQSRFLAFPPMRRVAVLLVCGAALVCIGFGVRASRRPKELPATDSKTGLAAVEVVINQVATSDFGRTPRGDQLTRRARELLRSGRIRFTDALGVDALYQKERITGGILYIVVERVPRGFLWPATDELARRLYHETLHSVVETRVASQEEECDGFCAAEEAAAAVENRAPQYPVTRDGERIWEWVQTTYSKLPSDPTYQPVGYSLAELAARTGIPHALAAKSP